MNILTFEHLPYLFYITIHFNFYSKCQIFFYSKYFILLLNLNYLLFINYHQIIHLPLCFTISHLFSYFINLVLFFFFYYFTNHEPLVIASKILSLQLRMILLQRTLPTQSNTFIIYYVKYNRCIWQLFYYFYTIN